MGGGNIRRLDTGAMHPYHTSERDSWIANNLCLACNEDLYSRRRARENDPKIEPLQSAKRFDPSIYTERILQAIRLETLRIPAQTATARTPPFQ